MSKEGSPYGTGFIIRMLVLLGILAAAIGGFYYDQRVLLPGAEDKVREVLNLVNARTDDGGGIPQSQVQEAVGGWAYRTTREHTQVPSEELKADEEKLALFKPKTYEVESYKFKRVLPFLDSQLIEIAYIDKAVVFSQTGDPITEDQLNSGFETKLFTLPADQRVMPSAGGSGGMQSGGGGGRSGGGNRKGRPGADDDDKDEDDKAAEGDSKDADADEKSDEEKEDN